jgi:hypothetical protein
VKIVCVYIYIYTVDEANISFQTALRRSEPF